MPRRDQSAERGECRKITRSRRENVLVLEKQWSHGCGHISFPKSSYDGKHAKVRGVSRWVEVKRDDQGDTKNLQDGPPRVALENGPNQDCACETRLMPRLGGFVQFYLGTWLHR